MASNLPAGYNPPSVFTQTTVDFAQSIVSGSDKTVAIIGVADETKSALAVEVIRGSSSTMDNPFYGADVSNQVTGTNNAFSLYTAKLPYPIVDGSGQGKVTQDPGTLSAYVNGQMVNVIGVNGATGVVTLQDAPMSGDVVTLDYYFKKKDTFVQGESLSSDIPVAPKLYGAAQTPGVHLSGVTPSTTATLFLALATPGPSGNYVASSGTGVSLQFIFSADGSDAYSAIQGNGSDSLTIDVMQPAATPGGLATARTSSQLATLIQAVAFTQTGGTISASTTGPNVAVNETILTAAIFGFQGGKGPSTAKVFQVEHFPIVDGTNGGITTTSTKDIAVYLDGKKLTPSAIKSVDGGTGQFTLVEAVGELSSLSVDYHFNMYRNTSDLLPNQGVLNVNQCGYSSRGIDFIPEVDFALQNDTINWGNSVGVLPTVTAVQTTPFSAQVISSVYDNKIFLVKTTEGVSDGHNILFTLPSIPVDGSHTGTVTDDPDMLSAYVGTTPTVAYALGPVAVLRVTGAAKQIMLQSAPAPNSSVYVTYLESLVADAQITLTCVTPGPDGLGIYSALSSKGSIPGFNVEALGSLASRAGFVQSRVVFPKQKSDLMGIPGATPNEVITLTFVDSMHYKVTSSRTSVDTSLDGMGVTGSGLAGGADGYLNQTFIDSNTGVRFTIVNPDDMTSPVYGGIDGLSNSYAFQAGDQLQITSSLNTSFTAGDSQEQVFIPGVKMVVSNLLAVGVGNKATLTSYAKSLNQPSIGDVYYVTYTYAKPASAYDLQVYYNSQEEQVYTAYGYPSPTNKLALAAWLAFRNGAKVVGLLQVKKAPGTTEALDSSYVAALANLQSLYPGMSRKPQIIVPLNTSPYFLSFLKKHVETQSGMKMRGECVAFFGFANNTNPSVVITTAHQMSSERLVAVYPDGGIITLTDNYGNSRDVVVDGSMVAVAVASLYADPQWDSATPRTRKAIVGFKRLFRRLDPNVMNAVAQAGVTLLEQA